MTDELLKGLAVQVANMAKTKMRYRRRLNGILAVYIEGHGLRRGVSKKWPKSAPAPTGSTRRRTPGRSQLGLAYTGSSESSPSNNQTFPLIGRGIAFPQGTDRGTAAAASLL